MIYLCNALDDIDIYEVVRNLTIYMAYVLNQLKLAKPQRDGIKTAVLKHLSYLQFQTFNFKKIFKNLVFLFT